MNIYIYIYRVEGGCTVGFNFREAIVPVLGLGLLVLHFVPEVFFIPAVGFLWVTILVLWVTMFRFYCLFYLFYFIYYLSWFGVCVRVQVYGLQFLGFIYYIVFIIYYGLGFVLGLKGSSVGRVIFLLLHFVPEVFFILEFEVGGWG